MKIERTQLKLYESKSKKGELIGFVSRHPKSNKLLGVREHSHHGKQVCVVAEHLKGELKPNVLYEVYVKPMHSGAGYVIMSADKIVFPANINTTIIPRHLYFIKITFGNRVIYFDPICGKSPKSKTVNGVVAVLREREDIEDKEHLIDKFINESANLISRILLDGVRYDI
ncbi:MAG: hypothetical protein R3Y08_05735 [Rikenellaceae bacterium]